MTTLYDIPAELLNPALAARLAAEKAVETPEWAEFVKTGVSRERPPSQDNWWFLRSAALMRKIAREGPIGVTQLSQAYGGRKDNGAAPNTPGVASRHIIRTALQQLEASGLVEQVLGQLVPRFERDDDGNYAYRINKNGEKERIPLTEEGKHVHQQLFLGRRITAAGQKMIDSVAHECRPEAEEQFPGLAKY